MPRKATGVGGRQLERPFQQQVISLARFYGWTVYFTYRSDRSPAGYPDLTMVRDGELVFAELKTQTGRLQPEQADWLSHLEEVSVRVRAAADLAHELASKPAVDVYLWRPADFDDIHARLARGRHQLAPLYVAPDPGPEVA